MLSLSKHGYGDRGARDRVDETPPSTSRGKFLTV